MMLSVGSAFAADLGGNCCADLEERVAELEATTARKGTRKTSLEVWGQVNKIIVAWDDGIKQNTALGLDNVNASTRFGFRGNAKIRSDLTAGYSIVIEQNSGGRSTNLSQFRDKANVSGLTPANGTAPPAGGTSLNSLGLQNFGANDAAVTMRESNWWLESSNLGRVTVGRFVGVAGPQGAIDLGGIGSTVAGGSFSLIGTGLTFRTNAAQVNPNAANSGNFTNYTIGNTTDSAGEYGTRQNGVLYTSPTWMGFQIAASYSGSIEQDGLCSNATCTGQFGNSGPLWSAGIKYAGEFNGVRVAAAYGHEDGVNENWTSLVAAGGSNGNGISNRLHSTNDGVSLSLMHVATGLFGQGFYNEYKRGHDLFDTTTGLPSAFSASGNTSDTAKQWLIQGGIARNWFGVGNTAIYGEYGETKNGFNAFGLEGSGAAFTNNAGTPTAGMTPYFGDVTKQTLWGIGVQQNLDAAAMEIFAGYRNFSLSSDNCTAAGGCKDLSMFTAGSRIKF